VDILFLLIFVCPFTYRAEFYTYNFSSISYHITVCQLIF
jgi:hypothetical protein